MKLGIAALVVGYVLSQFYRAFLAVLAPVLQADLGATPAQLADASGLWFLVFAGMQIPVGIALDRIGPRRTVAVVLGLAGAGGAALFAAAQSPGAVIAAMALIGVGCSPVLMASFYIFARTYPPAVFGTLAGLLVGVGNLGNLGAALPLSLAVEAFGWRATVAGLAGVTLAVALAMGRFIQDPPPAPAAAAGQGGLAQVLRAPSLWAIFLLLAVGYAPSAAIRGLWAGPYFTEILGATAAEVGTVTLIMGAAMVAGNFAYGPMDRLFGSRKWPNLAGNLCGAVLLALLWWTPAPGWVQAVLLFAGVGFFGMSFPLLMAHGRAFFPPHLLGRGVTILNLFGIGGVGLMQVISGRVYTAAEGAGPAAAYGALFGFFTLIMLAGCAVYAFSSDRTD